MKTHDIKGEDHYQCREVKAERDALKAEIAKLKELMREAYDSVADIYGRDRANELLGNFRTAIDGEVQR